MHAELKNTLRFVLVCAIAAPLSCSTKVCPQWQSNNITDAFFHRNGSVEDRDTNLLYPPLTYWAEIVNGVHFLHGCPCKLDKPCLRKCCDKDHAFDNETLKCIPYQGESQDWFRPNVSADPMLHMRLVEYGQFRLIYGNFCFGYFLEPEYYPKDEFYINFTDGTLTKLKEESFRLDSQYFCLEYVPVSDLYLPYVCFQHGHIQETPEDMCDSLRYTIYPIGMAISITFLVISLIIYAIAAELRNIHGKCLMCHISSLLVAYLFLAIVQSVGNELTEDTCTAFGFVIYFALLCSFFWLNIMCLDIYFTFSSFMALRGHSNDAKKFLTYVAYAWGLPLIIIVVTAIMEFHPGISEAYLKPQFEITCWFYSPGSRIAYFIAPIGAIILCNLVLFVLTAFNIYMVNKEKSISNKGACRKNRENKNRMKLYIELSVVMGVTWALEIISNVVGGSKCIWLFTDTLNTLQGFFIFLIIICKRNVKVVMKKRIRRFVRKFKKAPPSTDECQEVEQSSNSRSGASASMNSHL